MSLKEIADRVIETDAFIIGGGVAGLACAIKAKENNPDVAVFEKANTITSGICWMECPKRAIDIIYPVSFW